MAQRASLKVADDFVPVKHVSRAIEHSDCRTPVIFVMEDEDPFVSVYAMSKQQESAIWVFDLAQNKSKQNIMDYVDVSVKNGDWVYIQNCDTVDETFFRDVALLIHGLKPEPKKFPRREFFRCFFCVQKAFDPEGINEKPFPPLLLNISIISRKVSGQSKLIHKLPADIKVLSKALHERQKCRDEGSDTNIEGDNNNPPSGVLFYRATELYNNHVVSKTFSEKQIMEKAILEQDVSKIREQITSMKVDLDSKLSDGMTPLQLACALSLTESAKVLLDLNADPNQPRASDGRPPLFMYIDKVELAAALVDAGADLFLKFEGFRPDSYPGTAPDVADYLRRERTRSWNKK